MNKARLAFLITIFIWVDQVDIIAQIGATCTAFSPDRSSSIEIGVDRGILMYRIYFEGNEIIKWSHLGFVLDGTDTGMATLIKSNAQKKIREKFVWRLGEDDLITNNYNEITVNCQVNSLRFDILARVYDGSIAFRYEIPRQPGFENICIRKENTAFNFASPYSIYQYNQESVFTPVTLEALTKTCDFPATLAGDKYFISIGDADNAYYTKAELRKGSHPNSLEVTFIKDSSVCYKDSFISPWRTISISQTAIGLHDFSQLYLKLVPPAKGGIPAWIKPGKLIRAQLNTQAGLDCINFAEKHNFQYIMFDAGWYGAEFRSTSDPCQVIPQIDLQKVVEYGKSKGIGVILYVNYVGLRAKLDTILPLFKKWGIRGIKFGFVDGATQNGRSFVTSAIKKVNDSGFILDIHDNYKPSGLSRQYPALLTQEGIRGDENSPDAFHTTVLPFTRFLAGPADFTFCYPNPKNSFSKNLKVSKGQQLALTVVYFSPLQAIFWYGNPNDYTNEDEIEFFKYVPTVWNESHYLMGEIGLRISVARRSGSTWFVGNAAGPEDWNGVVKMDFLTKGKIYKATIYEDDNAGGIRKRNIKMKKNDLFVPEIKAGCGQAIILEPEK